MVFDLEELSHLEKFPHQNRARTNGSVRQQSTAPTTMKDNINTSVENTHPRVHRRYKSTSTSSSYILNIFIAFYYFLSLFAAFACNTLTFKLLRNLSSIICNKNLQLQLIGDILTVK